MNEVSGGKMVESDATNAVDSGSEAVQGPKGSSERSRLVKVLTGIAFVAWVAAVVLILGPMLIQADSKVGPATMSLSMSPARTGGLSVDVPPMGGVLAPTHKGPVEVDLTVKRFNGKAAVPMQAATEKAKLGKEIGNDVKILGIKFVVIAVIGSLLIGAAAAAMLPRRSRKSVMAGAGVGLLSYALLGLAIIPGFDANKFKQATAEGSLGSATALLNATVGLGAVDKRAAALSDKLADLYLASMSDNGDSADDTVILQISDIHLNPIGLRLAKQLASDIHADAILDTGDTTSFGLKMEKSFTELLSDMEVPYLWIGGNHDSKEIRKTIAKTKGVTPIDNKSVKVRDVVIAGVEDPTHTALKKPGPGGWNALYKKYDNRTMEIVERTKPDLLAVHNPVQAKAVLGQVKTIVAGHTHKYAIGTKKDTVLAVCGSSGATGLGSLIIEKNTPYAFQVLHYSGKELKSIDQVTFDGLGGTFSLARKVANEVQAEFPEELVEDSAPEGDVTTGEYLTDEEIDQISKEVDAEIDRLAAAEAATSGASGASGASGMSGASGTSGASGASGADSGTAPAGTSGSSGASGAGG